MLVKEEKKGKKWYDNNINLKIIYKVQIKNTDKYSIQYKIDYVQTRNTDKI